MANDNKRSTRVAERVRAELSELLVRGTVRDPRARDIVISAVRVTDDLQQARVYVRMLQDQEAARGPAVEALNKAAGFLKRQLGPKLQLRRVPSLEFFWDDTVDDALRMERILYEIGQETGAAQSSEDES